MNNEKLVVQRPFAVQSSTTCCGFSTANDKLWASEPLSSGSVHEILWLWLDNSVCACLCIGFPWLFQWCEFPKDLSSRDGSIEVIVKWQDGEASRTGISPRPPSWELTPVAVNALWGKTPHTMTWASLCDRRWPLWEGVLYDSNQPYIVVIRKGPSYFSHFATNTTTIHYFPSVPHPMEESPLPIYIEEGTEVPIGECSWDGICLREGIKGTWVLYSSHLCVPVCHWKW